VEELDWGKLNDGYLRLVSRAFAKKMRELGIDDELEL
jgi:hypothetical protein